MPVKDTKWVSSGVTKVYPRGDNNISMAMERQRDAFVSTPDATLSQPEKELRFALKRAASRIVQLTS